MAMISSARLLEYLIQLPIKLDQDYCLEFGDPEQRQMSGVQVAYITTAGGPQYRISRVNTFGQQYANAYTPSYEEAFDLALDYKDAYTRPNPRMAELRAQMRAENRDLPQEDRKLGWFETTMRDTSQFPAALNAHQDSLLAKFMEGAETITLELPKGAGKC